MLTWDLTKIKDYRTRCYREGELNPVTNTIILLTPVIGMGQITEESYPEFAKRVMMLQRIAGSMLVAKLGGDRMIDVDISLQDVIDHIGLEVNVPFKPRSEFYAVLSGNADDWFHREYDVLSRAEAEGTRQDVQEYPEHRKLMAVKQELDVINAFLDWLGDGKHERPEVKGLGLDEDDEHRTTWVQLAYYPLVCRNGNGAVCDQDDWYEDDLSSWLEPRRTLMARYFGIDEKRIEEEKQAMLEYQRKLNEEADAKKAAEVGS